MKRLRKSNNIEAVIPTSSMADIAFLLVVFFMVTTVFQVDKTNVRLPTSEVREEVPRGSAFIVIHQPNPGDPIQYKFSAGEDTSHDVADLDALYQEVSVMTSLSPYYKFVLKADGYLPYKEIDEVIQMLRRAKAVNVILLTQQE